MLTAWTLCPSLTQPRASPKQETTPKPHTPEFSPFYQAGSVTRAIRLISSRAGNKTA